MKIESEVTLMTVQCCKCKEFLYPKPGPLGAISHSFCPKCFEEEMLNLTRECYEGEMVCK